MDNKKLTDYVRFISEGQIKKAISHLLENTKNVGGLHIELISIFSRYNVNESNRNKGLISMGEYSLELNKIIEILVNYIKYDEESFVYKPENIKIHKNLENLMRLNFVVRTKGSKHLIEINQDVPVEFLIYDLLSMFDSEGIYSFIKEHKYINAYLCKLTDDQTLILDPKKSLVDNSVNQEDSLIIQLELKNNFFLTL